MAACRTRAIPGSWRRPSARAASTAFPFIARPRVWKNRTDIDGQDNTMLTRHDDYPALARSFTWQVPEHYNIGVDVCDKWADGSGRLALIYEQADGHQTRYSFDDIRALSNRLANSLAAQGVAVGDRVGILLP